MRIFSLLLFLIVLFFLAHSSYADRRNYVWTYQYRTLSQAETELEFYQTTLFANKEIWEYRIEVEHGFTERLDFAVYQIFRQEQGEAFKWDAVQFRLRYRFGQEGQFFMDPLVYLEYRQKLDAGQPKKIELKLILAKQIEALNISFNPLFEYYFEPTHASELGLDAGISYELSPQFLFGLEATSRTVLLKNGNETALYVGPTVSFASGGWWYAVGAGLGLNNAAETTRIRFLMGLRL